MKELLLFHFFVLVLTLCHISVGQVSYQGTNRQRNPQSWNNLSNNNNFPQRCQPRSCRCNDQYIPFCGSDGVTYTNKCHLNCAQQCNRGLRVNFEGVCAKPYVHNEGYISENTRRTGKGNTFRRPAEWPSASNTRNSIQRPNMMPNYDQWRNPPKIDPRRSTHFRIPIVTK